MADEKDRFGNKLRDKEHAEENRYFAQQDREKLEKLRAKTADLPVTLGLCPRCGVALVERSHQGVNADDCPKCGGIWLDKGELDQLLERADEGWASRWLRSILSQASR
jgi:Transcription factor zinc-finger